MTEIHDGLEKYKGSLDSALEEAKGASEQDNSFSIHGWDQFHLEVHEYINILFERSFQVSQREFSKVVTDANVRTAKKEILTQYFNESKTLKILASIGGVMSGIGTSGFFSTVFSESISYTLIILFFFLTIVGTGCVIWGLVKS